VPPQIPIVLNEIVWASILILIHHKSWCLQILRTFTARLEFMLGWISEEGLIDTDGALGKGLGLPVDSPFRNRIKIESESMGNLGQIMLSREGRDTGVRGAAYSSPRASS
jgi:hypothetical protein